MITRKMETFLADVKIPKVEEIPVAVTANGGDVEIDPLSGIGYYSTKDGVSSGKRSQYNVVFFGVKGVSWENAITIGDVVYPRSIFCTLKESGSSDPIIDEDNEVLIDDNGSRLSRKASMKKYAKDMDGNYIDKNGTVITKDQLSDRGVELDAGDQNSYATGIDGVAQSINQRLSLIQGELYHFINEGFPLLDKATDKVAMDAYLVKTVLHHPNVVKIINLQSKIVDHNYIAYINIETTAGNLNMTETQEIN